jgi:hypothetical protein
MVFYEILQFDVSNTRKSVLIAAIPCERLVSLSTMFKKYSLISESFMISTG